MTQQTSSRSERIPPTLEEQLRRSIGELRGTLTALLASISCSGAPAGHLARRLGVHKNLAWKVLKIVQATDRYGSIGHLPGQSGLAIFVTAAEREGASPETVKAARAAIRDFDLVVREHCGDRATLELVLDGLGAQDEGTTLAKSRKLAFGGNSGVFGLQAQVMLTSFFVAPSAQANTLDEVVVGGMLGLRRLRPDATWPLMKSFFGVQDDGTPAPPVGHEALDPDFADSDGPKFIGDFCTPNLPEIHELPVDRGTRYEFAQGRVGNTGTFDFFTGQILRGLLPRFRSGVNEVLEFHANVRVPVKTLQADLILHESLDFLTTPDHKLINLLHEDARYFSLRQATDHIPCDDVVQDIGAHPPVFTTPLWPRYDELVARVFDRTGWEPDEFVARRVVLEYPPLPAASVLQARLPEPE